MPLENFEDLFPHGLTRLNPPRWFFEDYSAPQITEFFKSCSLTETQRASLLDTNKWSATTNGYVVSPPDELVLALGKEARAQIYPILARYPVNFPQARAFRFPRDGFEERFADSGLAADKLDLLRSLTYTNMGLLCLCVDEPLQRSFTTNDFETLIRTLYATPALRPRLRVGPGSDIAGLVKYWGRGGRERTIRPVLESLTRGRSMEAISISAFLPAFARMRLDTYPDPAADPAASEEDCFYTALNFFSDQPDPKYANGQNARKALLADYYSVDDEPRFGDLILLLDANNYAVHVCVHIADDIVFTKNGTGLAQPWVLMRMRDMLVHYPTEKPLHATRLRRKETQASTASM
jgi:hypothetical protein